MGLPGQDCALWLYSGRISRRSYARWFLQALSRFDFCQSHCVRIRPAKSRKRSGRSRQFSTFGFTRLAWWLSWVVWPLSNSATGPNRIAQKTITFRGWARGTITKLYDATLTEQPKAWTVIPAEDSSSRMSEVLLGVRDTVLSVDQLECQDRNVTKGPFTHIIPSPNARFVALVTGPTAPQPNLLWVVSSEFTRSLSEYDLSKGGRRPRTVTGGVVRFQFGSASMGSGRDHGRTLWRHSQVGLAYILGCGHAELGCRYILWRGRTSGVRD